MCVCYMCVHCVCTYILRLSIYCWISCAAQFPCWHLWSCVTLSTLGTSHRKICRRSQAAMACPSQTHFNKWETHTAVITSSQRQKKKPHTHTYQKYTKSKVVTSNKKQIQLTKKIQPWQMGGQTADTKTNPFKSMNNQPACKCQSQEREFLQTCCGKYASPLCSHIRRFI